MTFQTMLVTMSAGMLRTCAIFAITLVGSLIVGMLVYFLRKCRIGVVRGITKVYISVIRGTPLMLQLLVWYFGPFYISQGLHNIWPAIRIVSTPNRFFAICLGFILNYAAYFAEIYRSGFESMPVGQYEAAEVLGYTKSQTFFRIILLQVVKRILPSITNEVITLVKDTSLAFTLAYAEVFSIAKQISASQTSFVPFIVAGVFYYLANFVVERVMFGLEKKMNYYK